MLHPRAELCENLGLAEAVQSSSESAFWNLSTRPGCQLRCSACCWPKRQCETLSWRIWNNHRNRNYYLINSENNCSGRVTWKNTGISSPDNFSGLVTSSLPDLFYYLTKYYLIWASTWLTKTRAPHIDKRAWRAPQSPSCGDLEVTSSLHNKVLEQTLGEDRQAWGWRSSSPKDQGGAPASTSDCSQLPSPLQLAALEEGMVGEQELLPTPHLSQLRNEMSSLKETVGNLLLLISSFHKDDPNSFQLGTCDEHVWVGACKDKLPKEKRGQTRGPQHSLQNSLQTNNNNNNNNNNRRRTKAAWPGNTARRSAWNSRP